MVALWGIAAHAAYDMFSWYKYISVILVFFPSLGLWSGNFFMIAPFPGHWLFVLFSSSILMAENCAVYVISATVFSAIHLCDCPIF